MNIANIASTITHYIYLLNVNQLSDNSLYLEGGLQPTVAEIQYIAVYSAVTLTYAIHPVTGQFYHEVINAGPSHSSATPNVIAFRL